MEKALKNDSSCKSVSQKLREALVALTSGPGELTASNLCKTAGVSRNALYRYHPEILHELRSLQQQLQNDSGPTKLAIQQLKDENKALRLQAAKLAALVDHYFSAWQESSVLLQRRERELSDLRKSIKSKPTSIRK